MIYMQGYFSKTYRRDAGFVKFDSEMIISYMRCK